MGNFAFLANVVFPAHDPPANKIKCFISKNIFFCAVDFFYGPYGVCDSKYFCWNWYRRDFFVSFRSIFAQFRHKMTNEKEKTGMYKEILPQCKNI